MSAFHIDAGDAQVRLRLDGELTVENARELHAGLAPVVACDRVLAIDAGGATRVDAAALQVIAAAAAGSLRAELAATSPAWEGALRRLGLSIHNGPPNA